MLTDTACKNAKWRERIADAGKVEKVVNYLTDGKGLRLEVQPNGSKYWRLYYRHAGVKKRLA